MEIKILAYPAFNVGTEGTVGSTVAIIFPLSLVFLLSAFGAVAESRCIFMF